jgi:mono/diheme cytochrome c family protein
MKGFSAAFALACLPAFAQQPRELALGAEIYARNCSPCHGARMLDPQGAFDLKKFPRGERERFFNSVTKGKNQMPPWGGLLKPEELDALWLYVLSGER